MIAAHGYSMQCPYVSYSMLGYVSYVLCGLCELGYVSYSMLTVSA